MYVYIIGLLVSLCFHHSELTWNLPKPRNINFRNCRDVCGKKKSVIFMLMQFQTKPLQNNSILWGDLQISLGLSDVYISW